MTNTNDTDGSTDDLSHSRYLTKNDCGDGLKGCIKTVVKENIAPEGATPELGHVVLFTNLEKGMVLNKTRGQQIAEITGSKKFRDWVGAWIEMFNNPEVTFGPKITGGIRVREPEPESEETDDNGFDLDQYTDEQLRNPQIVARIRETIDALPVSTDKKVDQHRLLSGMVRRAKKFAPAHDYNGGEVPL